MWRFEKDHQGEGLAGITAVQETRDLSRGDLGIDVEWIGQVRFADPVAEARPPGAVRRAVAEIVERAIKSVRANVFAIGLVEETRLHGLSGPVIEDCGTLGGGGRAVADPPLAEEGGLIAGGPEACGHGLIQLVGGEGFVEIINAMTRRVLTGHEIGAVDAADGSVDETVVEDEAGLGQAVEIRRVDGGVAGEAGGVVALVVSEYHHHVRAGFRRDKWRPKCGENQEQQSGEVSDEVVHGGSVPFPVKQGGDRFHRWIGFLVGFGDIIACGRCAVVLKGI